MTKIRFHIGDLPDLAHYQGDAVAIDTETLGLNPHRDRLCVVQFSPGDGTADVVQIAAGQKPAPNPPALLRDSWKTKIFHYGRFDIAELLTALLAHSQIDRHTILNQTNLRFSQLPKLAAIRIVKIRSQRLIEHGGQASRQRLALG